MRSNVQYNLLIDVEALVSGYLLHIPYAQPELHLKVEVANENSKSPGTNLNPESGYREGKCSSEFKSFTHLFVDR